MVRLGSGAISVTISEAGGGGGGESCKISAPIGWH